MGPVRCPAFVYIHRLTGNHTRNPEKKQTCSPYFCQLLKWLSICTRTCRLMICDQKFYHWTMETLETLKADNENSNKAPHSFCRAWSKPPLPTPTPPVRINCRSCVQGMFAESLVSWLALSETELFTSCDLVYNNMCGCILDLILFPNSVQASFYLFTLKTK